MERTEETKQAETTDLENGATEPTKQTETTNVFSFSSLASLLRVEVRGLRNLRELIAASQGSSNAPETDAMMRKCESAS